MLSQNSNVLPSLLLCCLVCLDLSLPAVAAAATAVEPMKARVNIRAFFQAVIDFTQDSPQSTTQVNITLAGLAAGVNYTYQITMTCDNPLPVWNPTNVTDNCHDSKNPTNCIKSGDLSGMHGQLLLQGGASYMATNYEDSRLNMFGQDTITGKFLAVVQVGNTGTRACEQIKKKE